MKPFDYARPVNARDAAAAFGPDAAYLAGGTNLVDLMKHEFATPGVLVDICDAPQRHGRRDAGARGGA